MSSRSPKENPAATGGHPPADPADPAAPPAGLRANLGAPDGPAFGPDAVSPPESPTRRAPGAARAAPPAGDGFGPTGAPPPPMATDGPPPAPAGMEPAAETAATATAHPAPLAIRYRPLRALAPYARNARTHSAAQLAKLRASLARYGWTNPMLVADDAMIAGHARLQVALAMAEAGEAIAGNPDPWAAPTVDLSHLSVAERAAYVIADNRLAEDAGWDNELLRLEMADLQSLDFDLSLTGFEMGEIGDILGGAPEDAAGGPRAGSLADKFGVPPFTVLNAREGWWQDRKRAWLAIGIKSELGRGGEAGSTPPHGPSVTQNPDGSLNYTGSQRDQWGERKGPKPNAIPGGSPEPLWRAKNAARAADMSRSDAVMPVAAGDVKANLLAERGYTAPRNSIQDAAAPGGSLMPATNYRTNRTRGDGRGNAVK